MNPKAGRTASIERAVVAIKAAKRKINSTLPIRKDANIQCVKERLDCASYLNSLSVFFYRGFFKR
jgi:hypothetical protein